MLITIVLVTVSILEAVDYRPGLHWRMFTL